MQTTASPEHIRVFDNFVEPEDLAILDALCRESVNYSDDHGEYDKWWYHKLPSNEYVKYTHGAYKDLCSESMEYPPGRNIHPLVDKYTNKLAEYASYHCGHKLVPIFGLNRHQTLEGGYCPGHQDAEALNAGEGEYLPEYAPHHVFEPCLIDTSANIYINDDYEGGKLTFEHYGIEITHTPGQLVLFPGSLEYNHGVGVITKGTRWNLLTHLARPKIIQMHSHIYNLFSALSEEEKSKYPKSWRSGEAARGTLGENTHWEPEQQ
jgi:hypothetical protein